jgi:glycosyltransferase involved in cell wall biosynthesis
MGANAHRIKKHVIPSGIDLGRFKFTSRGPGDQVAFVARLSHKKGLDLLAQVAMMQPGYQFHVAGEWQDTRYQHYFATLNLPNVHFHGRVEPSQMPAWLADKNYILCTSPFESQGLGLMEAMAMGIKPLVHNFPGANLLYPAACLWQDLADLSDVLEGPYNSQEYRQWVEISYSNKRVFTLVNKILPSLTELQQALVGGNTTENLETTSLKPSDKQQPPDNKPNPLPRLAVTMIVKNEAANLPRCLDSIKPFADELIVVDTGSTDNTVEILKQYDATVYHHEWQDNFSLHRNQVLGYVPESCGWLLMIDADEQLVTQLTQDKFKRFLASVGDQYNAVALNMKDMQDGRVCMDFNTTKIFRRGKVQYKNIVHNEPVFDGTVLIMPNAHLVHYGYDLGPEEKARKHKRTIALLEKRIADNPADWKAYFYLGQAIGYFEPGNHQAIIDNTLQYIQHKNDVADFNLSAYFTLIRAYMQNGQLKEAWQWILQARAALPDDLDIAMAMLEYGGATNNAMLVVTAAAEFNRIWELYENDASKKGGRFIYSHNQEALLFVNFYNTSSQLQLGAASLAQFQELLKGVPEKHKLHMMQEMDTVLQKVGVSLVPSEAEQVPQSNVH